jgi:hypothetical protein
VQLRLRPVRHEAWLEQPVAQQIGNLLPVVYVGLALRDGLDVAGVDQQQLELVL